MRRSKIAYSLGCLKDTEGLRDIPMGLVLPLIKVPGKVDHTPAMTPFRDQGDEGTCVAFASAVGVKEYEDTRECKKYSNLKIPGARAGATRVMDILSMNISNVIAPTPGARRI